MYYFIVNYTGGSGKTKKTWNRIHFLLNEKGIEYKAYVTKRVGHAQELAARISEMEDEDIRLVVVGGDGTINEVLNGITDFSRIRFGVIPTGSGNDFARGLNISKNPDEALDLILASARGMTIDLGEVIIGDGDRRVFGISSGIGLDAIVCKKNLNSKTKKFLNKIGLGSLSYVIKTITTLFSMEKYSVRVKMNNSKEDGINVIRFNDLIFLASMNFAAEGGGVPMNPGARADDGLLSICAVSGIPKWRAFLMLPVLVKGKHVKKKGFLLEDVESLVFDAEKPMVLHADGEYLGDVTHIEMRVLKDILNILV
ncbi:MAG: diacylglycerol kinase family lipid kinase [Eubacterium sp.]|nr:diacylglycerol kinase family lipid kinase [Eubacterium sp.]